MPDVTVCGVESLLVHVTVSPTLISIGFGSYESVVKLDEPGVMSAVTVAAKAEGLLLEKIATAAIKTLTTRPR